MCLRTRLACLSLLLLLLLLLQFETPCYAGGVHRFKAGGSNGEQKSPKFIKSQGKNGDDIFAAQQRKVYTGPNPLHNKRPVLPFGDFAYMYMGSLALSFFWGNKYIHFFIYLLNILIIYINI
ncbi:hypothetical protein CXB51_036137 [Gossypium anomalum]|uniref:Uncharacterized protein n=1 Tax=Gossypium anomalum TaxID=47600 RepID=A0A8J5XL42_9ROSI|nr:hypothetical protein CXB51_036137 [Gossypium anomalum]